MLRLRDEHGERIREHFPEEHFPEDRPGRKPIPTRAVLTDLANTLREEGELDESECFFGATFASARGGGEAIGPTRRGKGVKIMAIFDHHGLSLAVSTHAANHHEVTLVQLSFDSCMIEAKPENLIGDRA